MDFLFLTPFSNIIVRYYYPPPYKRSGGDAEYKKGRGVQVSGTKKGVKLGGFLGGFLGSEKSPISP